MTDGPRAVRANEMDALRRLTDIVFRPLMPEQYPQLFNAENLDNLRVTFDGDVCTSHVGMTQRDALIMGCAIRVCCIGSVATHPDYREQGLASACFLDSVDKAHADGVDVMIVSGGRGLYTRNGCLHLGHDTKFNATAEQLTATFSNSASVTIGPLSTGDLDLVAECYRKEPVRFVRTPKDYGFVMQSGWAMNAPAEFVIVRSASALGDENNPGEFLGYVVVRNPEEGKSVSITEFAGDRHAVLAALPQITGRYRLTGLNWQVMGTDNVMKTLCQAFSFESTATSASGTLKLINFPQLMRRMSRRFEEIIGAEAASDLRFEREGEQYLFGIGMENLVLDRDTATRAVFGDLGVLPAEIGEHPGRLGEMLRAILPIPTLWYGLNYA